MSSRSESVGVPGTAALAIVQQASSPITALLVAGAGGSAVCADVGARKIREECDAMAVQGGTPGAHLAGFNALAQLPDLCVSEVKALLYGYTASGGPAGVGVAVGRAVRTSIVLISVLAFFLSLAIRGATTTVRTSG